MLLAYILVFSLPSVFANDPKTSPHIHNHKHSPAPNEDMDKSPILSAMDSLKKIAIDPAFSVNVTASEPLVQDPVFSVFDAQGSLWVVEMTGYMQNLNGAGESDPSGKIIKLIDENGDGNFDRRIVVIDKLVLPRALAFVRSGILVGAPPQLWYYPNPLVSQERVLVDDEFGGKDNPEHEPNGLYYAIDNWFYNASFNKKYQFRNGVWIKEKTEFRGQWGLTQDYWGRLYYSTSSFGLRGDSFPPNYTFKNPLLTDSDGSNEIILKDRRVWPAHATEAVNLGNLKGILQNSRLAEFTAACSPWIYQANLLPLPSGVNAFVCEPSGNLVKMITLSENGPRVQAKNAWDNKEFLTSTDTRFRPVSLSTGPDGALYVVDMYRGNIQHKAYLTDYMRETVKNKGLESGINLGRIYRISRSGENKLPAKKFDLTKESTAKLVGYLSHPNSWWRESAQKLLVERQDFSAVTPLERLSLQGEDFSAIHALWTLDGLDKLSPVIVVKSLHSAHPKVIVSAIRLAEKLYADGSPEVKETLLESITGIVNHPHPKIRLQLLLTLANINDSRARETAVQILIKSPANDLWRNAFLTGAVNHEIEFIKSLAAKTFTDAVPSIPAQKSLSFLSYMILKSKNSPHVQLWLELLGDRKHINNWQSLALLDGVELLFNENPAARDQLLEFPVQPLALIQIAETGDLSLKIKAKNILDSADWPGRGGIKRTLWKAFVAPILPKFRAVKKSLGHWKYVLSENIRARFGSSSSPANVDLNAEYSQRGKAIFSKNCQACHHASGEGISGLAPALAGSEWVLGDEGTPIKILLHGLNGDITVKGQKFSGSMPSFSALADSEIAEVLTYVRGAWGNAAPAVKPETVQELREKNQNRNTPWSPSDLK